LTNLNPIITINIMPNANHFHASCVLLPECDHAGILITGAAQSGKSSLALALVAAGGLLVSDDQTILKPSPHGLIATAPEGLRGLIEIGGYGIVQLPAARLAPAAALKLSVVIVPPDQPLERAPNTPMAQILAVKMLRLSLRSHDPAAVAKIMAVLSYPLLDYSDV
jgi:HPr kinase/phosphorylase